MVCIIDCAACNAVVVFGLYMVPCVGRVLGGGPRSGRALYEAPQPSLSLHHSHTLPDAAAAAAAAAAATVCLYLTHSCWPDTATTSSDLIS